MAAGKVTARTHIVQVQFVDGKANLHVSFCRDMEDTNGEKGQMGMCEVELEVPRALVKPLVDLAKTELKRISADPKGDVRAEQFDGITIV